MVSAPRSASDHSSAALPGPPSAGAIAALQAVEDYPAVTLVCSVDNSRAVGDLRTTLRALAREAKRRLAEEYEPRDAGVDTILSALEHQIAHTVLCGHPAVMVFASSSVAGWYPITEIAEQRVVVDTTFATRDLVHAQVRGTDTYVLHLTARTRLYAGRGHRFHEVHAPGLPFADPDHVEDPQRQQRKDASQEADRHRRTEIRELDEVLTPVLTTDPRPLVLIGSERRLSAFNRNSQHSDRVVSRLFWGGRHLDAREIDQHAGHAVDTLIEAREREAMTAIDTAIKTAKLTTGIENCWAIANLGLAEQLVVESSYATAARLDPELATIELTEDRDAPDVVDDIVDELIEVVLTYGGKVAIVADGALDHLGQVAICARA